jgi:hypothetical protein
VVAARTLTRLALVAGPFVVGCWATWWLWLDADLLLALLVGGALFVAVFPVYGAVDERATQDMVDPDRDSPLGGLAAVGLAALPGVAAAAVDVLGERNLATALWIDCMLAATGALVGLALASREPVDRVPA